MGANRAWGVGVALVLATVAVAVALGALWTTDTARAQDPDPVAGEDPLEECTDHPPIRITEDVGSEGFVLGPDVGAAPFPAPTYRPGSGVVGGLGTEANPYVIEGWCISHDAALGLVVGPEDPDTAIRIADTSAHVVVRDNVIAASEAFPEGGIRVEDAENVDLEGNRVAGTGADGVLVRRSGAVDVRENTIVENDQAGVRVADSPETTVTGNDIPGPAGTGIDVTGSKASLVSENTVTNGSSPGIEIADSPGVVVAGNTVTNTTTYNLVVSAADDAVVENNLLEGTDVFGMRVRVSENVVITGNEVSDVGDDIDHAGVVIQGSTVEISDNRITDAYNGIEVTYSGSPFAYSSATITSNTILRSELWGINYYGLEGVVADNVVANNKVGVEIRRGAVAVTGNALTDNPTGGIECDRACELVANNDVEGSANAITLHSAPVPVTGNTLRENDGAVYVSGASGDDPATSPHIENNTMEDNFRDTVFVWGTGAYVENNTIANGTVNGIRFQYDASGLIANNEITGHDEHGIWLREAHADIHQNNIRDNGFGGLLADEPGAVVDATDNWWGASSGPSGDVADACTGTVADGDGQAIDLRNGAEVCFDPWLPDPNDQAGVGS